MKEEWIFASVICFCPTGHRVPTFECIIRSHKNQKTEDDRGAEDTVIKRMCQSPYPVSHVISILLALCHFLDFSLKFKLRKRVTFELRGHPFVYSTLQVKFARITACFTTDIICFPCFLFKADFLSHSEVLVSYYVFKMFFKYD